MTQKEKEQILFVNGNHKAVFKLDKNFHLYVHGKKDMMDIEEDEKGKYLKLYFDEIK
ncbi:MAG: hypothetical protein JKY55_12545 [Aliivibrio sp.]|uniref:hypothetical protein n=1 Tax=Aliivibrio sp. TaxID=1872443 RepID=UPI001A6144EC|nr:hypothetical protein [Aliivibrio sp.]